MSPEEDIMSLKQLITLSYEGVTLHEVREAFNRFTNITESQRGSGAIWISPDSIGGRTIDARLLAPEEDFFLGEEEDRHGYPVAAYSCRWVAEVEFTSATSGNRLRWVSSGFGSKEEGPNGTLFFTQGRVGYFGSYHSAFMEAVASVEQTKAWAEFEAQGLTAPATA